MKDCKICGNPVSFEAASCPSCGSKPPKRRSALTWVVGLAAIFLIGNSIFNSKEEPAHSEPAQLSPAAAQIPGQKNADIDVNRMVPAKSERQAN